MREWFTSLFGQRPKELPAEVQQARAARDAALGGLDQAHEDLGDAIHEADLLMDKESAEKNGIIRDFEEAEKGIKGRP